MLENKENLAMNSSVVMTPGSERRASQEVRAKLAAKQEKAILHDFEVAGKEFRTKMSDQLKCLGERTEVQVASLGELQDFFRRRGELEAEYATKLEKLSKSILTKHKAEKGRRDAWTQHTSCHVWQTLVDQTREEAKKRQVIGELYSKHVTASIESRCDDLTKLSKRCREIGSYSHNELSRVLNELQTAMKTYQLCYAELSAVERKKRLAEDEKRRYEEANSLKAEGSRKHKALSKHLKRREEKYEAVRVKCTKARNEYLLCVKAANAALHRFFAQDLSYLIDCMDLGMDFWLRSILEQVIEERKRVAHQEMDSLAVLGDLRSEVDAKADKQRFFEANHNLFMLPKQFEFRPQLGDDICEVSAEASLAADLLQRQKQIEKRLDGLRLETEEVWKTLEASEKQIRSLYASNGGDDMSKWRNDLLVTYQYYMKKFEFFLLNGNLMERLEARSRAIAEALAKEGVAITIDTLSSPQKNGIVNGNLNGHKISDEKRRKTKRIGGSDDTRPRPKLFGGSLDEYVEATGESIPLLVESAVRYLSRFSLRNQGLFRISGSQSEINRFKDAYEKGEDVFSDLHDGSESNSVAGVLKLYLRELREPLFPIFLFEQFCDCAKADSPSDFVRKTRELISKLPLSHVLLLRFLFSFLSHLCEFADENMMEPHNMAICFGPTLLPIPEGKDQVFYHNYVNELVRNLIMHADEVFPRDIAGPVYDKYALQANDDEQLAYIEDNEMSDDDDAGIVSSSRRMLDSTYDTDLTSASTAQVGSAASGAPTTSNHSSPRVEQDSQPSVSSRSSNRSSNLDNYFRRMSTEEGAPVAQHAMLRTEMPHRIANELNAIFKNNNNDRTTSPGVAVLRHSNAAPLWESQEVSIDRDYVSPPAILATTAHIAATPRSNSVRPPLSPHDYIEVDDVEPSKSTSTRDVLYSTIAPRHAIPTTLPPPMQPATTSLQSLHATSNGTNGIGNSSTGVRKVNKSSLRDQLQLIRKDMNTESKTLPNGDSNYLRNGHKSHDVLDARGSTDRSGSSSDSSRRPSVESSKNASTPVDDVILLRRGTVGSEASQSDVSAPRVRPASPTLDEIVAAFNDATRVD